MIITVTPEIMEKAAKIVDQYSENKIGFNDAIAYVSMLKKGCTEIYTFDKHFNLFKGIKRMRKLIHYSFFRLWWCVLAVTLF